MVKAALFDENSIKCISPICAACKSYPKIKSRLFLSMETLKCSRGYIWDNSNCQDWKSHGQN